MLKTIIYVKLENFWTTDEAIFNHLSSRIRFLDLTIPVLIGLIEFVDQISNGIVNNRKNAENLSEFWCF